MKILLCVLLLQLLPGLALAAHAAQGVYVYTAADGAISLSNVAVDERYQALIVEQGSATAEPRPIVPAVTIPVPVPAVAAQKPLRLHAGKASYGRLVDDVARRYGLDSALLHAVISVESRYDATVISRRGAIGLMQLMPATATRYGVINSFDAAQNLHGGAQYLRDLLRMFNNNLSLALAAYNAGENAVIRCGNCIPRNQETRKYVPKVLGYYRKYRKEL